MNSTNAERQAIGRALISDDDFSELINIRMPAILQLSIGDNDFAPELHALLAPKRGEPHSVVICKLIDDRFNEQAQLCLYEIGQKLARERHVVVCVALMAEAWLKSMSKEEHEQRGRRRVDTYEDREEVIMIAGRTIDGRCLHKTMMAERGDNAEFCGFPPRPEREEPSGMKMPILEAFYAGYMREAAGDDS